MEQKPKKERDWVTILAILIMLSAVFTGLFYLFETRMQECTSNPLVYASEYYEENYGLEFFGSGSFNTQSSPIIFFNKHGLNVEHPNQDPTRMKEWDFGEINIVGEDED